MNQAHFRDGGIYTAADLSAGFSKVALKSLQKTLVLYFTWHYAQKTAIEMLGVRFTKVETQSIQFFSLSLDRFTKIGSAKV